MTGRSRSRVASYCSWCRRVRRAIKRSMIQSARPNSRSSLLAGEIHGEAVGIVGVALRAADFVGVAIAPDAALAKQPVRRQPRAAEQRAAPTTHMPRGRPLTASPPINSTRPPAMKSIEIDSGGPVMPEVEVTRDGQVAGERRVFEMTDAGRTDACFGEAIVEPRRGAIAEVGADRLMDRRQDLEQDEGDADERERLGEASALLHRADQPAHGDREERRQSAASDQDEPPGDRQPRIRARQHGEELPFFSGAKALQAHGGSDVPERITVGGALQGMSFQFTTGRPSIKSTVTAGRIIRSRGCL